MKGIDYSKLRSITAREIISALIKDGFSLERQSGSHQQYYHQDGRRVTVSFHHPSDTFTSKILKSMIEKQAKWTSEDLERLKLIVS
jgi:predicted RNA binding protein YcfA (HicA-like mRNA interferase family)